MCKSLFLLSLLIFVTHFVHTQPTQAELEKMMKQAQEQMKKYSGDTTLNKVMQGLQDQQKQVTNAIVNQSTNTSGTFLDPSEYSNVDHWKFPAKNTAFLSALPKKIFTRSELISFLDDLYGQLSKKLTACKYLDINSIVAKYGNSGVEMGDAAALAWYTNHREESLLLVTKAAAKDPDNGLLLNNCAAILNMAGLDEKAIPILKYLLPQYPNSPMLLNNLGQAYAGLGETDTAMRYLTRSIKTDPENSEANNTAGQIAATKGNTEQAVSYFENSIRGAYSKPAYLKLRKIKIDTKLFLLINKRITPPNYFEEIEYELPKQCEFVGNAVMADFQHEAFRSMLSKELEMYSKGLAMAALTGKNVVIKNDGAGHILKKDDILTHPIHELFEIMSRDFLKVYQDSMYIIATQTDKKFYADLKALVNKYNTKKDALTKSFADRERGCCTDGEGGIHSCCIPDEERCKAYNDLANDYLPVYATRTRQWQDDNQALFRKYFNYLVYWHYLFLMPTGRDSWEYYYYLFITDYLKALGKICTTITIGDFCDNKSGTAKKSIPREEYLLYIQQLGKTKEKGIDDLKNMACPINVNIPFFKNGSFILNCGKTYINDAADLDLLTCENDDKTKQSTLSFEENSNPGSAGKPDLLNATTGEADRISFDGKNGVADFVQKNKSKGSSGAKGTGTRFGINSGWNFCEGPFKGLLSPKIK